jgi:hypothetical protein
MQVLWDMSKTPNSCIFGVEEGTKV